VSFSSYFYRWELELTIVTQAEKELKTETEFSRRLQASKSSNGGTTVEESAKDAAIIRLYEELTDLGIVNVRIKEDAKTGKEMVFNCIATYNAKSEFSRGHFDGSRSPPVSHPPFVEFLAHDTCYGVQGGRY
jgi:hypothetical protein